MVAVLMRLRPNESKLHVSLDIRAQILERELELLDSLSLLDSQLDDLSIGSGVEQLLDAFNLRVVEEAKEKHLHLSLGLNLIDGHFITFSSEKVLFSLSHGLNDLVLSQAYIDEGDYSLDKSILGCLNYNYEFLAHERTDLESDLLLQLLGQRVFNEPAVKLNFGVLDLAAILILKWELVSVVLSEDIVAVILIGSRDSHGDDLVLITYIAKKKG